MREHTSVDRGSADRRVDRPPPEVRMSTPAIDRIIADARIDPHDTPHEAAAHVWSQVVARHDLPSRGALGRLGMLERAVLVLGDVVGLSTGTIAEVLNCNEGTVRATREAACERIGLPRIAEHPCDVWDAERADLAPGDPTLVDALLAHAAGCDHCTQGVRTDRVGLHQLLDRRATARHRTGAAAVTTVGTTVAAAAILAVGVAAAVAVAPTPQPSLPVPLVVDASPNLPSDEEPLGGWPAPTLDTTAPDTTPSEPASTATEQATTDDTGAADAAADGEPDDGAGSGLTDTVDEAIDDVGEVVDDTVREVEDTVRDVEDTVDETTERLRDDTERLTDDVTEDLTDDVEDLPVP